MIFNRPSLLLAAMLAATSAHAGTHQRAVRHDATAAAVPAPLAFAVTTNGDFNNPLSHVGILDINGGFFYPLATLSAPPVGVARDAQGLLYAVDYHNDLVRINPLTGKVTIIGPTGLYTPGPLGAAVDVFTSLSTGELFLMDYFNDLYSVDPSTGAAKKIGSTGIPMLVSPFFGTTFAGDCNTLYFTVEEDDENGNSLIPATLYRIDPRTAASTRVGPTASFMGGSGFIGNALYGFKVDEALVGGVTGPQVLNIDLATGKGKTVSNLTVPSVFGAVDLLQPEAACQAAK
jgi:hypothetical protein